MLDLMESFIYLNSLDKFLFKLTITFIFNYIYIQLHSSPLRTIGHFDQINLIRKDKYSILHANMTQNNKHSSNQNSNSNSKSKSGKNGKPTINNKSGCIIRFKPPKASEDTVKAKFFEDDDTEVSESIRTYSAGDDYGNLVASTSRIIGLGDMYDLWIEGKSKKLAQVLSRALDNQVREEWQAITS